MLTVGRNKRPAKFMLLWFLHYLPTDFFVDTIVLWYVSRESDFFCLLRRSVNSLHIVLMLL